MFESGVNIRGLLTGSPSYETFSNIPVGGGPAATMLCKYKINLLVVLLVGGNNNRGSVKRD